MDKPYFEYRISKKDCGWETNFSITDANDWNLGKEDFTIDFWVTFSVFSLAGNQFLRNRFLKRN